MANILVLGVGPLPFEPVDKLHAPGIRTWQIVSTLAAQRHFITLCIITFGDFKPGSTSQGSGTVREDLGSNISLIRLKYNPKETADSIRTLHVATRFGAVVSTSDIMNGLAVDIALDVPMWLDYNGDPFAEKQLQASMYNHDGSLLPQWELYLKGLARGDRFSVCSNAQKYALIGQLGYAGRFTGANSGEQLVHVIPNCSRVLSDKTPVRSKPLKGNSIPATSFLVLWSGGYNTWCDPQTLFNGLENAMSRDASIYFATTGGALDGHDTKSYEIFKGLVEQSTFRDRFIMLGWIPTEEVGSYYEQADVAVFTDKNSVEGELGTRTRMVDWIMYELPIVCTSLCEFARELSSRDLIYTFPVGDSKALADQLCRAAKNTDEIAEKAKLAKSWFKDNFKEDVMFAPLTVWAKSPKRSNDHTPEITSTELSAIQLDRLKGMLNLQHARGVRAQPGTETAKPATLRSKFSGLFKRK